MDKLILKLKQRHFFLGIIVWGLPFSIFLGNSMLIFGLLGVLFLIRKENNLKQKVSRIGVWGFPMLFFVLVLISAFVGANTHNALVQVEKHLLLLVISAVFILAAQLSKKEYSEILKGFVYANLLLCLILMLNATIRYLLHADPKVFFFHEFGSIFDLHPVYISINFAISALYIQQGYNSVKGVKNRSKLNVLAQLLLVSGLLLCASKAVLSIFFILVLTELVLKLRHKRQIFGITVLLFTILLGVLNIPQIRERFKEGLVLENLEFSTTDNIGEAQRFTPEEKGKFSDLEFRFVIWKIGLYHLKADNRLLLGYGIADSQAILDYYYMFYGLAPGWYQGYNLHNQYLQYLFTFGILGLLLLMFYLAYSFRWAFLTKNKLQLYFLIMVSWVFVFECLLSRNKGLVIVFIMNGIFMLKNKTE
jgi:O-antigen ligase